MGPELSLPISKCIDNIEILREWKKSNFSDPKPKNILKDILDFYQDNDNAELVEDCILQIKEYGFYM